MYPQQKTVSVPVVIVILLGFASCAGRDDGRNWASRFENGTYLGVAEYTQENGIAPFLAVTVENGSVVEARFEAIDASGSLIAHQLPTDQSEHLIEHQTLPETNIHPWFERLARAIEARATDGDTRPALVAIGGTYAAEDSPDEEGWIGRIELTYVGSSLDEIRYDELQRDGKTVTARKSEDTEYITQWRDATGTDLHHVYERLAEQLFAEGLPSGVDIVSGATHTSRRFRLLAGEAMDQREAVDFLPLLTTVE